MNKNLTVHERVVKRLNVLRNENKNGMTGRPASYSEVITILLKETGRWKLKKQEED